MYSRAASRARDREQRALALLEMSAPHADEDQMVNVLNVHYR